MRFGALKEVASEVIQIWTGRTPEGQAYRILKEAKSGGLSLKEAGKAIDDLEAQNHLPVGTLRRGYETALTTYVLARRPRSGS